MEIKSAEPTLKPNYILLPVTQTNSVEEFNKVYQYWHKMELDGRIHFGIKRTRSGGIKLDGLKLPVYDVRADANLGAEMVVLAVDDNGQDACYRLQYRTFKDNHKVISGRQAYERFRTELKRDGVELENYLISSKEGHFAKKGIEKPLIKLARDSFADCIWENAHHLDIHNSYPSGIAELIPEWRPTIERLYYGRHEHPENKDILNLMCGYLQSEKDRRIQARGAHISAYAIKRNNEKVAAMAKWLNDTGRMVIAYNTDGIWFVGPKTDLHSKKLGEWEEDHTNCQLRFKSAGAYEYIENGIYTPVIRGATNLQKITPKNMWKWGDIYRKEATPIIYVFDREEGIKPYEKEST